MSLARVARILQVALLVASLVIVVVQWQTGGTDAIYPFCLAVLLQLYLVRSRSSHSGSQST